MITEWLRRLFTIQTGYSPVSRAELCRMAALDKRTGREILETGRMSRVSQVRLSIIINRIGRIEVLKKRRHFGHGNNHHFIVGTEQNKRLAEAIKKLTRYQAMSLGIHRQTKLACNRGEIPTFETRFYHRLEFLLLP